MRGCRSPAGSATCCPTSASRFGVEARRAAGKTTFCMHGSVEWPGTLSTQTVRRHPCHFPLGPCVTSVTQLQQPSMRGRLVSLRADEETQAQRGPVHSWPATEQGLAPELKAPPATWGLSHPTLSLHRAGLWGIRAALCSHTGFLILEDSRQAANVHGTPDCLPKRSKCPSASQARLGSLGWL